MKISTIFYLSFIFSFTHFGFQFDLIKFHVNFNLRVFLSATNFSYISFETSILPFLKKITFCRLKTWRCRSPLWILEDLLGSHRSPILNVLWDSLSWFNEGEFRGNPSVRNHRNPSVYAERHAWDCQTAIALVTRASRNLMAWIDHEWDVILYPLPIISLTFEIRFNRLLDRAFYRSSSIIQTETAYLLFHYLPHFIFNYS